MPFALGPSAKPLKGEGKMQTGKQIKEKMVHMAKHISQDGRVSPLCAAKPRAINLSVATWTNRESAVTCKKCKELLK